VGRVPKRAWVKKVPKRRVKVKRSPKRMRMKRIRRVARVMRIPKMARGRVMVEGIGKVVLEARPWVPGGFVVVV
jgi:hypothetical protein